MPHRCGMLPEDWVARGLSEEVGRKLLGAAVGRGETDLRGVHSVKKAVLAQVEAETTAAPLRIASREPAPDGFVKYLFELEDGARVEAVRIPVPCEAPGADLRAFEGKEKKYIVCVSSQAGCALACAFCATGKLGFLRNLTAAEIVGQILAVRRDGRRAALPTDGPEPKAKALEVRPVRGVVFMGMGEPMLNYEQVIRAARILCHPAGGAIDARSITISTAGIVPQIRRFTAEKHKFRLAVSLTHAAPGKRLPLMPIEGVHSTAELVAALHDHARTRRTRVLVEYVLLGGVNDSPEDARALARLLDRALVKVDLIDVNGDTGGFRRSSQAARSAFLDVLAEERMPFAIRYSGGQEVAAGCGQLAAAQPAGCGGARML
jgi:23S rRNA (adenine2503-C2)-methyltransferase